jgi:hypothetical protein
MCLRRERVVVASPALRRRPVPWSFDAPLEERPPASRRGIEVARAAVERPDGATPSFACPSCDYVLWDGVCYTSCPVCDLPVDWVDLSSPLWCCSTCDALVNEPRAEWPVCDACATPMTEVHALERPPVLGPATDRRRRGRVVAETVLWLLGVAQMIAMTMDPVSFAFIAPLLLVGFGGACVVVLVMFVSLGELRAVVRDRHTRVIHGLEHACVKLLQRDGHRPLRGLTHPGSFEIDVAHDGRTSPKDLRRVVNEAIKRIRNGERALAHDPRCGTSLLVGALLAAVVILAATSTGLLLDVPLQPLAAIAIAAVAVARLGSRPLGLLAQRLTVATHFASASVHRVVLSVTACGSVAQYVVYIRVRLSRRDRGRGAARASRRRRRPR